LDGTAISALNEAPTLLLVVIVLLAVFKNQLPLDLTTWLIVALVVLMAVTIQLYAKKRRKDQEKLRQNTPQKEEVATR
jgi:putative membrane protein